MLVKFNPTLGTTNIALRAYNFMRVITAVATAAANSTPVVRPMTAQNTFNNSLDLITEVIANSEAGGWTVSGTNDTSGHNLPDTTYTDANLQNRVYRADFFRNSGKATYPFTKFTVLPQVFSTWTSYPYMDIVCGCHVDSRYNAVAGYQSIVSAGTTPGLSSVNITAANQDGTRMPFHGVRPNETAVGGGTAGVPRDEWLLAITENYFILIQPWHSITYFGTRTAQPWELGYDDNPAIVAWHTPLYDWTQSATNRTYMPKKTFAWWRLKDGFGQVRPQPYLSFNQNLNEDNNHVTHTHHVTQYATSVVNSIAKITSDGRSAPLFNLKANRNSWPSNPTPQTNGINYYPVTDPTTGVQVPPAHPIYMQLGVVEATTTDQSQAFFNEGGRCLGIYKSLSGSDAFMDNFYTPGQNFIIDGENYYPYVTGRDTLYRDMFLIRRY
jgi:hypothetical protein